MFFLRINLTINVAHPVFLMHTQSLLSGYTPGRHSLIIKPRWPLGARRSHYSTTAKEAAVTRASSLASLKMKQKTQTPADWYEGFRVKRCARPLFWLDFWRCVCLSINSPSCSAAELLCTSLQTPHHWPLIKGPQRREGRKSKQKQSVRAKVPGKQSKIELWHHWEIYDSELNCNLNLKL